MKHTTVKWILQGIDSRLFPEICSTSKLTCLPWVNAVYQDSFACGSLAQKDSIIASSTSGQYTERPLKPGNPSELNLNFPDIPFTNHWHAPHPLLGYAIAETEQLHSKLSYSIEYTVYANQLPTLNNIDFSCFPSSVAHTDAHLEVPCLGGSFGRGLFGSMVCFCVSPQ